MSRRSCWADGHSLCVDAGSDVTVLRVTRSIDAADLRTAAAPPAVPPTENREFARQFHRRTNE